MKETRNKPPKIFLKFFRWYCHPGRLKFIEGDLMEVYERRITKKGKRQADLKFILDVILLFRPGIMRPLEGQNILNPYGMYKSYLKIGWRNLLRNKGYSLINIGGLALGMAVAMLIGLWLYDELTFNKHHRNYDRIAQVMKGGLWKGQHFSGLRYLPFPLIDELKTNYASNFKHVVPVSGPGGWSGVLTYGDNAISKTGMYIGEEAPEMFTWQMMQGTWSGLSEMHSIMISASTAQALFGDDDPMGKIIKVNSKTDVTVTGVFKELPKNSEFQGIDFYQPWSFYLTESPWVKNQTWQNHFLNIYVEINPNASLEQVGANIMEAEQKVIRNMEYMQEELKYKPEVLLLPMRDWHLRSSFQEGILQEGPMQMVWFIGSIGVFVLLLACVNFMNLSTARSEKRAKEVGIRKTIGSVRNQLVGQFLSESFLVVALAFVLTLVIVVISLPWFNTLSGKAIRLPLSELWFWTASLGFLAVTGLLAGSYPAFYLSSFKPVSVLKGLFHARGNASLPRKVLVIIQFTVSVILIACTGVIYDQLMFVKDRPVGYNREGLVMVLKKSDAFYAKADAINAELKNSGAVSEVAESAGSVTAVWSNNAGFTYKGESIDHDEGYATLSVSHDFGKTVGWQFVDGRDFDKEIASDSSGIVINEAAAKFMGIKNPVGEVVHWKNGPWGQDKDFRILGVIKDMIMDSPFRPVHQSVYFLMGGKRMYLLRVTPGMPMAEALPKIEGVFRSLIPEVPFTCEFADQAYASKFDAEDRIGKLAAVFAALAIAISCLGLLGLASFVAEQRTKEIGIRKILGASVASLWRMLSNEFVVLVTVSCVIAVPVSYYILSNGIREYEYHKDIAWWIFVATGVGVLVITLMTISFQSIKAAMANPVKSLRSE